jgi:dTDP-4-dehydrorhamnose 3,5-epimerase
MKSKWNEFIITPSTTFNGEVIQYQPSVFREYRGEIWTTYHSKDHPCVSQIKNQMSVHGRFSRSYKGVLRGLHWDTKTWKLVQATVGDIYLVVLDMRGESITYGKWESFIITERLRNQVLIPPGFANGHLALTDCVFHYNLFYNDIYIDTDEQKTVKWNDSTFNIEWPITDPILSKRDGNEKV